jgi:ParB family chromosome partitioning protein
MGKLDELRKAHGANIGDSFGTGTDAGGLPPGMSLAQAQVVPDRDRGVSRSKHAVEIPTDRIQADPDQPREEFDEESLGRLAESLRARGQLQPIRVRWDEGRGAYVIVMGERRWRAAVKAGLATLSCVVHQGPVAPGELLAMQLVENAVREDLRPIERAKAYRRLQELHGWSGNQLAKELAIPQPAIVQALALLKLPDDVQAKVEAGELAPRTAYEISKLDDDADRAALADRVVSERMTGDQVADVVKARKSGGPAPAKVARRTFKLPDGHKVTIEGPSVDAGDAAMADVLARLRKQVLKEAQGRGRGADRSPGDRAEDQAA